MVIPSHRVLPLATATLLLLEFATVLVPVIELGRVFHFPAILVQPASVALPLFRANEGYIVLLYAVFLVSSLLYIPLAALLPAVFVPSAPDHLKRLSTAAGVTAAICQMMGFSRWLLLVPYLAHMPNQALAASLYEVANRYLGATVGEFLGFVAMAVWTLLLAAMLLTTHQRTAWQLALALTGLTAGALILISCWVLFQPLPWLGIANFAGNTLWALWIAALAVWLLRAHTHSPVLQVQDQADLV